MKSALETVTFSGKSDLLGLLNLIETTREALIRTGHNLAAAHLDMALLAMSNNCNDNQADEKASVAALLADPAFGRWLAREAPCELDT